MTLSLTEEEVVDLANTVLARLRLRGVDTVEDVSVSVFVSVFEALFGTRISAIVRPAVSYDDDLQNAQTLVEVLGPDLVAPLQGITPEGLCARNRVAVGCLLLLFNDLLHVLAEQQMEDDPANTCSQLSVDATGDDRTGCLPAEVQRIDEAGERQRAHEQRKLQEAAVIEKKRANMLREFELFQQRNMLIQRADELAAHLERKEADNNEEAEEGLEGARSKARSAAAANATNGEDLTPSEEAVVDDQVDVGMNAETMIAMGVPPRLAHQFMQQQLEQWRRELKSARSTVHDVNLEESVRRQRAYEKMMQKQQDHAGRMRQREAARKGQVRKKRQAFARKRAKISAFGEKKEGKRRVKSRQLRRRDNEEKLYRNLFGNVLKAQRNRLREERQEAREEMKSRNARRQLETIALENYYRDQMSMLASDLKKEAHERRVAERAQELALDKWERDVKGDLGRKLHRMRNELDSEDRRFFTEQHSSVADRVARVARVS